MLSEFSFDGVMLFLSLDLFGNVVFRFNYYWVLTKAYVFMHLMFWAFCYVAIIFNGFGLILVGLELELTFIVGMFSFVSFFFFGWG